MLMPATILIFLHFARSQVAFVGVGNNQPTPNRAIAYSLDGITWTSANQNVFSSLCNSVTYSAAQNKWIAAGVGTANTLAWSPDGMTWTGLGLIFSMTGYNVAYSAMQNRWVAVGQGTSSIYYSANGLTWTAATPAVFTIACSGVTYSSTLNQWVAVGAGGNTIAVSSDGITWTGLGNIIFSSQGISVNYANGIYVATGDGTITQAWSTNGITWTGTPEFISTPRYATVYAQGKWLLAGPAPINLQNSTDGKSWTSQSNAAGITDIRGITYNPAYNRYVAIGSGTNNVVYSSDGINWNPASASGAVFNSFASFVATTGTLSQTIVNPTPITTNVINLVTNTSIINANSTIAILGNLTVLGDLAIDGTWILQPNSSVTVNGTLSIKGNTTFNALKPINCQYLTISSALGDSQLDIILTSNLTIGNSVTYPIVTYTTRTGTFNYLRVRSAPAVSYTDCPVATQDYSSSTLTVTITMTSCNPNPPNLAAVTMSTGMIVGISVGCAVAAGIAILVMVILMKRHQDKMDAITTVHLRNEAVDDLKQNLSQLQQRDSNTADGASLKPSPGVNI